MENTSLSSLSTFVGFFENTQASSGSIAQSFYYEKSTNSINFGYGINLTCAASSAIRVAVTIR